MKTYSKTSLPDTIEYKGETYYFNAAISGGMNANSTPPKTIAATLKKEGRKAVLVNVLSKNLRRSLDLHNKPYEATKWIFTTKLPEPGI